MAFTSRAKRFVKNKHPPTTKKIGPGSYNIIQSESQAINHIDPSSFHSTTARGLLYYEIDQYKPEPGQYFQQEIVSKSYIAHSNFKSKTKRFVENNHSKTPVPGPTDYNVKYNTIEQKVKSSKPIKYIHRPSSANNVIPKSNNPPSIPYGSSTYGYETSIDGKLIRRSSPLLKHKHNNTTQINPEIGNKGSYWSKSKSERFAITNNSENNNLNVIQHTLQKSVRKTNGNVNNMDNIYRQNNNNNSKEIKNKKRIKRKGKKVNRILSSGTLHKLQKFYADQIALESSTKQKENKNPNSDKQELSCTFKSKTKRFTEFSKSGDIPGVGTYNIDTKLGAKDQNVHGKGKQKRDTKTPGTPHQHHEYGKAQSKNNNKKEYKQPGPGSYDIKSTFESVDEIHSQNMKLGLPPKAPFLSTVCKFNENIVETNKITPGPGYYTRSVLNETLLNKPQIKYNKAPFGQHGNVIRNNIYSKCNGPGPAQYDVSMSSHLIAPNTLKSGATFVFKSESDRIVCNKNNNPGVGTYNISANIDPDKAPHNMYRFETKQNRPFMSAENRFLCSKYTLKTPGVGQYSVAAEQIGNSQNIQYPHFGTTSTRSTNKTNDLHPAPNAYNVIKKDSFVTKTYNCTYG
eukprot:87352_1